MWSRLLCRVSFLAVILACAGGCHGRERVVGFELDGARPDAASGTFGPVRLIPGLLDPNDALQDPTLSGDELEMYFASDKDGTFDIWKSTRPAVDQPWGRGIRVTELSTTDREYEPTLSEDGLTVYVSRDVGPYFQIFVSRRPSRLVSWGVPEVVMLGATPHTDRGPAIDRRGNTLVFASSRVNGEYDLFLTQRPNQTAAWQAPLLVTELSTEWQDWDPALFSDGLALAWSSRRDGDHLSTDLYQSRRISVADPFGAVVPMTELNSSASEGDPWLSDDGHHVVFASERGDGISRIYEAWR